MNPNQGSAARPKPRLVKQRKHGGSSTTNKSKLLFPSDNIVDPGFNPFRPTSFVHHQSAVTNLKKNFGNVEGFVFGGAGVGHDDKEVVVDGMRELKIRPDHCSSQDGLEYGMTKLKVDEPPVFVESSVRGNVKSNNVTPKETHSVVNSFGYNVEMELPTGLNKLNIKDSREVVGTCTTTSSSNFKNANEGIAPLSNEMEKLRLLATEVRVVSSEGQANFAEENIQTKQGAIKSSFPAKDFTFRASTTTNTSELGERDILGTPKTSMSVLNEIGFSGFAGNKIEFSAKRESVKDAKSKKERGKLKKPSPAWHDYIMRESSSSFQEHEEDPYESYSYSPMDISPYQETVPNNIGEQDVASEEASCESLAATDEDLVNAAQCLDINNNDATLDATKVEEDSHFRATSETSDYGEVPRDDSDSGAETESFVTADVQLDYDSGNDDTFITAADTEVGSSENQRQGFSCGSISEDNASFTFSAASSSSAQMQSTMRQNKKKNRYRVAQETYSSIPSVVKVQQSTSMQFFQPPETPSLLSPRWGQKGDLLTSFGKRGGDKLVNDHEMEQDSVYIPPASVAAQEACEKWRLRGNQAYSSGDMLSAEDYYSQGVNSISQHEKSKSCLRALMLCYSNRAAARMSRGRLRQALGDCKKAAGIDPKFLRVQIRAANCHLALGEVENASLRFTNCLQSGNDAAVDQQLALEASEGLEKAQKVSEWMKQSTELVQQKTQNAAESALRITSEALKISAYSDKLLELKAEALFMLQKYEELIHLCEQTIASAEFNRATTDADNLSEFEYSDAQKDCSFRLWRCRLIFKSYFCLGRLEAALEFLKKQDESVSVHESKSTTLESSIPLVGTVRKLVRHKGAGNEAFQLGNYAEAVEHYSVALSCTVESRPFAAVCFCNRAAAYKAMGQVVDAIADCSIAIALDGNYIKAISRRASLFEMIRDYDQAPKDLRRAASLLMTQVEVKASQSGPSDKLSCINELRKVQRQLSDMEEEAKKEIPMNMYLILGVDPSVSASEIKKAYRKAALRHHPDKACQSLARSDSLDDGLWKEVVEEVHKDADRLFKMIGEAYAILSEPIKRSQYDIEEEMRKALKRGTGGSRMHTDNYSYESGSNRHQWRDVWRSYGNNSQPRASDAYHRSSRF